ncbi:MAG: TIM barrel protein [Bacteroidota bacterium]
MRNTSLLTAGTLAKPFTHSVMNSPVAIACQQYTWMTFCKREGYEWGKNVMRDMEMFLQAGTHHFEPLFTSLESVKKLKEALEKFSIQTSSLYVNSTLYLEEQVASSIEEVIQIAEHSDARIIVTNPKPIQWGGDEDKSDEQLVIQARALNRLGKELQKQGKVLAYHNHDAEMRQSAREFHHMLSGTDAQYVKLCLDAHWIYRGSGNSQVALFDIVKLYGDRIVELHLRQSQQGIWSEVFDKKGDVDYERLVITLRKKGLSPHIVLEQAVEEGTPHTLTALSAQKQSLENIRALFKEK